MQCNTKYWESVVRVLSPWVSPGTSVCPFCPALYVSLRHNRLWAQTHRTFAPLVPSFHTQFLVPMYKDCFITSLTCYISTLSCVVHLCAFFGIWKLIQPSLMRSLTSSDFIHGSPLNLLLFWVQDCEFVYFPVIFCPLWLWLIWLDQHLQFKCLLLLYSLYF